MKKWLLFCFLYFGASFGAGEGEKKKLTLKADKIDFTNEAEGKRAFKAEGNAEVDYANYTLCAGTLYLNEEEDSILAKNNVVLSEKGDGGAVIKTGEVASNRDFSLVSAQDISFEKGSGFGSAGEFNKESEVYKLKKIKLSGCKNDKEKGLKPMWSIASNEAKYERETDTLSLYNTTFLIKDFPVLWFPFFTIQPSRTHGFLAPQVGYQNDQVFLRTPYFISEATKTHYLVITPEFWFNKPKQIKEEQKISNLELDYKYSKNEDAIRFNSKFVPSAFLQDETTGEAIDDKGYRYSTEIHLDFKYEYGNYGFNYNTLSDRFFRRFYLDIKDENYLTDNLFINYFDSKRRQGGTIETSSFKPITFEEDDTLTSIPLYGDFTKSFLFNKNIEVYNNFNVLDFTRDEGFKQSRVSNSVGFIYSQNIGKIESKITPDFRIDYYKKNYDSVEEELVGSKDRDLVRYVSSVYIENSIPFYFKLKQSNDFLFKVEPLLNMGFIKQSANQNKIFEEDTLFSTFDANSVFLLDNNMGYDLVDEGINANYGIRAGVHHFKTKTKFDFTGGQRVQKKLQNDNIAYSDFAFKSSLRTLDFFSIENQMIVSTGNEVLKSTTGVSLTFTYIDLGFDKVFMKASFTGNNLDINVDEYFVRIKLMEGKLIFYTSIVQNNNFLELDGTTHKKNVGNKFEIKYLEDCIEYLLGITRERYLNTDIDKKYKIYGSIKLIF